MDITTKRKILWLRIGYWLGAVVDGAWIIPMMFPSIGLPLFGVENYNPDIYYRFAMAVASALMLGWTVLLIWADRKPIERRGILLLTVVPVKVCCDLAVIYPFANGLFRLESMIGFWIHDVIVYGIMIYAYVNSRDLVK
jgi:hypothetical protein